jgi:hypothetical protein
MIYTERQHGNCGGLIAVTATSISRRLPAAKPTWRG